MTRKVLTLLVAVAALAGCRPAAKAPVHDTFTKLGGKADASVPSLSYGGSASVKTLGGYGWLRFTGERGDHIDVWARSHKGDAVAFVLDDNDDVLAANDDADEGGSDAHLVATLPAAGTYWIAVRDYGYAAIAVDVSLGGTGVFTCKLDTDCVAVPKAGCCDNGWREAVNKSEVETYESLHTCAEASPVCSHLQVHDTRIAVCSNATQRCELIAPQS